MRLGTASPTPGRPRARTGRHWPLFPWTLAAITVVVSSVAASHPWPWPVPAQEGAATRQFAVSARRYRFTPARLEVREGDLVTIRFTAEDIAHSFTIDAYRIAKRANPGQTVTFEFHADRLGTFPYYCNLAIDDGCRAMRGELVVRPR